MPIDGEQQEQADLGQIVADVFGIGEDTVETIPATAPAGTNEPSVGTEGAAGEGASAEPVPTPAASPPAAQPGSATPAQPEVSQPLGQPTPAPQTPPATPEPDPRDLQIQSLQAQVQQLLDKANAAPQPGTGQPGAGQQQPAQPQIEPINVQLPPQITDDLFGDDPTKAAAALNATMSALATGLVARMEQRVQKAEQGFLAKMQEGTQETAAATAEQTAAEQRADYYKQFPHHNKPVFAAIIATEASKLAAEHPGIPWTEQFRDALGTRVNKALQEAGITIPSPGSPTATQSPAAPTAPAAMIPTGVRPAPAEGTPDLIADTFSFD